MTATLTIVQDTWLTLTQSQSTDLPDNQKHHVLAGEIFTLLSYEVMGDFMRVTLDHDRLSESNPFNKIPIWYVNWADVRIIQNSPVRLASFSNKNSNRVSSQTLVFAKKDTDTPVKNTRP
ncbi:hypothetical protein ACKFKF_20390 [Phormidesmis sp. 146-12]